MNKNNVIAFNENCVPVQNVIDTVSERTDIKEIYVVLKNKDGEMSMYGSGDLSGLSDAALYLFRNATNIVMQKQEEIPDEE